MIELFPERMLDGSIHTAVLLGIIGLWAMTESLGWVFAGFVVPGYLAALGAVAPMSLVAIVVEAILTYGLVWALGIGANRVGLWTRVFGRERFLLFIVGSVPVRLVVEGLAAPHFEAVLRPLVNDPHWQGSQFFGIGVVLVPLVANALWKLGISRGLFQVGTVSFVTWLLLTRVLIPLTNFRFGGFERTFEDVALDFMAVPKIYVILVTTAFIAARNNVRYGWDYGGILAPSLLAIIATRPAKLVSTVVEILVLTVLYRLITALPGVRRLDLGGPRRIVSLYLLAYALKWLVATVAQALEWQVHVSDLYGFGYLLTSIVAAKAVQRGNFGRAVFPLLWTAGQGVLAGLLLSIGLGWVLPAPSVESPPTEAQATGQDSLEHSLLQAGAWVRADAPGPTSVREADFIEFVHTLDALAGAGEADDFHEVLSQIAAGERTLGWATRADGRRCLVVHPARDSAYAPSGAPSVWWCGGGGPGLYLPRPLGDPDSTWVAAWLAHRSDVSVVIVEGLDDSATVALGDSDHRTLGRLRRVRAVLGDRTMLVLRTRPGDSSWLDPRTPLASASLAHRLGPLSKIAVRFEEDHGAWEPTWQQLQDTDGLLTVSIDEVSRILDESFPVAGLPGEPVPETPSLDQTLASLPAQVPQRTGRLAGTETPGQRLAAVQVVLGTALHMAEGAERPLPGALRYVAQQLGVQARTALDEDARPAWVLSETEDSPAGWGVWTIRPGGRRPWVIAAPLDQEEPGTGQVAAHFFHELDAVAVWRSLHGGRFGADRASSTMGPGLRIEALALQQALRPRGASIDRRLLVVRRQPYGGWTTEPVVLSRGVEFALEEERRAALQPLAGALLPWPGIGFDDGRASTASLNTFDVAPVRYLNALEPGRATVMWASPLVLSEVSGTVDHEARVQAYLDQGVPVASLTLAHARLTRFAGEPATGAAAEGLLQTLRVHADTLSDDALAQAREHAQVEVIDTGLRLVITGQGQDEGGSFLCAAVAGARASVFPLSGCWRPL